MAIVKHRADPQWLESIFGKKSDAVLAVATDDLSDAEILAMVNKLGRDPDWLETCETWDNMAAAEKITAQMGTSFMDLEVQFSAPGQKMQATMKMTTTVTMTIIML